MVHLLSGQAGPRYSSGAVHELQLTDLEVLLAEVACQVEAIGDALQPHFFCRARGHCLELHGMASQVPPQRHCLLA